MRGIVGIVVVIFIGWLLSYERKSVNWRIIGAGFSLQILFAFIVLKTKVGAYILGKMAAGISSIMFQANAGISFLFGSLGSPDNLGMIFAFQVLPLIVFFGALVSVLYYLGIMQLVIKYIGGFIGKVVGTKEVESISAAANIFLGQTDAPLLVKPYISNLSRSELFAVLTGGVASVSGTVLAGYAALGVPMKYLIAGSFMAAPSGLIFAKLIMPEKSGNIKDNKKVVFHKSEAVNIADAAAKGTMDGLKMAVSMGALLVAFIGLITLANTIVADIGGFFGVNITIQKILGYLFSPLAYVMGIPWNEAVTAGSLLGEKMVLNEFVAYASFGKIMGGLSEKTITIMSFALLGFANISSIAILIGGVGGLAPDRKKDIAKMGVRAILGGFLASILNGIIAGVFFG